ncbi:MAG: hypothetical protein MJ137_06060, partial [Clostridia bacterium]|nr:hypothetical protein [Clostridia bacterium]
MDIKKRPAGRLSAFVLSLLLIVTSVIYVFMQPASAAENDAAAEKLKATFAFEGFTGQKNISDGNNSTFATGSKNSTVAVMADKNISFIYISYNHAPGEWKLSSGSKQADCGRDGFIHEYVDVKSALGDVNMVSLSYPAGAEIESVAVYGEGKIPDDVQVWQPPCENADILLLSAHTDDDQLYFAGLIPYYVTVRGAAVQVAYFTEHLKENYRWHERLNGLWTAGMRNYPVISSFPDAYSSSAAGAYTNFKNAGFSEDQVVSWVSEQLRRFKPQVTVTHDFTGEYGDGQVMAAVGGMTKAVPMAADKSKTLGGYEPFEVLKSYVHVYDKNKIVIDAYDTPFEELGGLTPFAVSQKAFLCHKSQLKWTDLT